MEDHLVMRHPLARGAFGRCPRCGLGKLFRSYLKVVDECTSCGEKYGHFHADDAAPWLTILVVGPLTVPAVLIIERRFEPPTWFEFVFYLPLIVLLTLALLPRCKGVSYAGYWVTRLIRRRGEPAFQ